MLALSTPSYSLSDAFIYLQKINASLVRYVTETDFLNLFKVQPQHTEPSYIYVDVYLDELKEKKIYLVHSNLGYLYFNSRDCLLNYKLDKKKFYFDFKLSSQDKIYHRDDISFASTGHENWSATFDYEEIFNHFGLSGDDDFAPFVGIYILK